MVKIIVVMMLLTTVVIGALSAPAEDYKPLQFDEQETEEVNEHLRFRRVTCDLLSFGGMVSESACAANCLSMGKAGGHCNNGVCQCRKTNFKDLWNRRFGH